MSTPITIDPAEPLDPGLDYVFLKAEGTALVQELSGELWTNYNESDPGVTTLEQLCYALTELAYRAELPVENLLLDRPGGHVNPRRQALFPARRIFPCHPLTVMDYRKLLLDRIPLLGNVWLQPHQPRSACGVNGLYDIALYVPSLEPPPCTPPEKEQEIRHSVQRVYCRHRNLCEDLRTISILRPAGATVFADVAIGDGSTAEATLADLFFRLGNLFAPEPRRRSLQSLMEEGVGPSAIFNGPLLLNGFIDDDQLQPKARAIRVQDVIRSLAGSPAVLSVRNVRIRALGKIYSGNEWICVPRQCILRVDTEPDARGGGFTIRLFRNGLEVKPDAARVQRELAKLWANQRRTWRLSASYETHFGFPKGTYSDVERYYSIQNQFPDVYGINAYGLEPGVTELRQAQARQFKAYLLVYDQLLADFFAQLARARDLYSTDAALRHTYFFQFLEESVPNIEPLLQEWYRPGLARIVHGSDPYIDRRNRFLDFLLALYAEALGIGSVWDLGSGDAGDASTGERLIRAKIALLRHLVASTHNRGRGVDYLERPSRGNMAGMETKIRIQLGMNVLEMVPLAEVLEQNGIELVERDAGAAAGRPLTRQTEIIEEQFVPVPWSGVPESAQVARGLTLPESLLGAGGEIEELRIGKLPGDTAYAVVWKSADDTGWRLLGKSADRDGATVAAHEFAGLLRTLRLHCQQFYIVEHTLLRFGRFRGGEPRRNPFVYSFTATAVFSPPASPRSDGDYGTFVRETVRANAPAHIVMEDLFLRPAQMKDFEPLYWAWRRALRRQDRREIAATSFRLREFLQHDEGPS